VYIFVGYLFVKSAKSNVPLVSVVVAVALSVNAEPNDVVPEWLIVNVPNV
jgi:hypothetical protein